MLHGDALSQHARAWPDRPAVVDVDHGRTRTYAELDRNADRSAAVLRQRFGVGRGDRVAVHARNRVEQVEVFFACARLGALLVPFNWRLAAPELSGIVADCEPAVVLCDEPGQQALSALPAALLAGVPRVRFDRDWGDQPAWCSLRDHAPSAPTRFDADPSDPLLVLYTSGSTGRPKGALLTHGSLAWNAINTVVGWGLGPTDCTLTAAPLFHTGGWNVFTLPLLYCGGTVELAGTFDPDQALQAVHQGRATVLFGVPTMYQAIVECGSFETVDLSGLRFAISGGAPCPEPLHAAMPALRVRAQVVAEARNSAAGLVATDLQRVDLYLAECLGLVGRVRSTLDEPDADWTSSTEVLRLGIEPELRL